MISVAVVVFHLVYVAINRDCGFVLKNRTYVDQFLSLLDFMTSQLTDVLGVR